MALAPLARAPAQTLVKPRRRCPYTAGTCDGEMPAQQKLANREHHTGPEFEVSSQQQEHCLRFDVLHPLSRTPRTGHSPRTGNSRLNAAQRSLLGHAKAPSQHFHLRLHQNVDAAPFYSRRLDSHPIFCSQASQCGVLWAKELLNSHCCLCKLNKLSMAEVQRPEDGLVQVKVSRGLHLRANPLHSPATSLHIRAAWRRPHQHHDQRDARELSALSASRRTCRGFQHRVGRPSPLGSGCM